MDFKKTIMIFAVFAVLCLSIGMVSANTDINVPVDYTLNDNLTLFNQTGTFYGIECEYDLLVMEKGDENITVTCIVPTKSFDLEPQGNTVPKTINSKDGLFEQKEDLCVFMYIGDGQIVQVEAPNEEVIGEVIGD